MSRPIKLVAAAALLGAATLGAATLGASGATASEHGYGDGGGHGERYGGYDGGHRSRHGWSQDPYGGQYREHGERHYAPAVPFVGHGYRRHHVED